MNEPGSSKTLSRDSILNQPLPVLDPVTRYEKIHRIGEGTYGIVYKARDLETGELVALKKIRFDHAKEGIPVTSMRELRVLQQCKHPNVVKLHKVATGSKPDSVFLVFEYCEHDLGRLLDTMPRHFSEAEAKCLLRQLLEAVAYLHRHSIMHRDLKLSNLLYTSQGLLKLCDFGLARYIQPQGTALTSRVVTLWYRAPELLLGAEWYNEAVDMWSVGCVMGELLQHAPLFPAENELQAVKLMCKLLGAPNTRIWPGLALLPAASTVKFPDQPYNLLKRSFPELGEAGVDLLNALLTYNPERRITAEEALRHPYFEERPFPRHPSAMPTFPSSHEGSGAKRRCDDNDIKRQYAEREIDRHFVEVFGADADMLRPPARSQQR